MRTGWLVRSNLHVATHVRPLHFCKCTYVCADMCTWMNERLLILLDLVLISTSGSLGGSVVAALRVTVRAGRARHNKEEEPGLA